VAGEGSQPQPAELNEFPFHVSIRGGWDGYGDFGFLHLCSGTLLSKEWILTTASCCNGDELSDREGGSGGIYAMAGGLGLGTWDKIPSEQHVEIDMDKKIIHPRYSSRYFSYDLCMLKTKEPFNVTDAVAPVKLPENDNELGDAMFTGVVTGWKRRRFAQRNEPTPLMKFSVNIDPTVNCHFFLPDQAVCGQYFDGGYNACGAYPDGDIGGPLIAADPKSPEHNQALIGVVRNTRGCPSLTPDFPEVYTKVSAFLDWIKANMNA